MQVDILAKDEEKFYHKLKQKQDQLVLPLIKFLAQRKIGPNIVSLVGLLILLPFIYFFRFNPWIASIFIIIHLLCDVIDGSLARYLNQANFQGMLVDRFVDYVSFFIIFITFEYFGLVDSFFGSIYLLNYVILLFMVAILNSLNIRFGIVIRSKYYVYILFGVWLLTGQNFINALVMIFSLYMIIVNVFLFNKLRCSKL